ncbi:receptor like protein 27-like [Salvia hispanica]|uniref:receptor like protein 27-like n=1 Tax=Salvia hispanica TaxID=49212 RepID=UPI00200939A0|nr:receptor like protein 27-like [Salvia hispanica]
MSCNLNGSVPSTFANLTKLIYIDLFANSLTGSLSSTSFEGLSDLTHLNLRSNSFSGDIPQSLYALPSLLLLYLGDNQFTGTFQLDSLQSLANNLTNLDLSNNNLSVDVGSGNSSSYGRLTLKQLYLALCNLSEFPYLIKFMDLEELILSKNRIASEIPSWIWGTRLDTLYLSSNLVTGLQKPYHIPASIRIIDLGSNQLKGELELSIPPESTLLSLSLNNNSLSGSIPTFLSNVTNIDHLVLSDNKLSGAIESAKSAQIRVTKTSLSAIPVGLLENIGVIDLKQNNIIGNIPDIISMECTLRYLELSNNNLEGKIPKSLERCESLAFMNVGYNNIDDTFPCMLSSTLSVLGLCSNRFYGDVSCHKSWSRLRVLDISSNNFGGSLESMNFSSWSGMMMENVSDSY